MRSAAIAFLAALDGAARGRATYGFDDGERFNWHFIPRERNGLPLGAMSAEQRVAAHRLMRSALSSSGYLKATSVMELERVLRELGGNPAQRDPENYFFTVFGTPSADAPWGWRLEGHHMSINFTAGEGELVSSTPTFFGTNPASVTEGSYAGLRVLGAEEDIARELLHALTPEQRARAVIAAEAPRDIITGAEREISLTSLEGIAASELNAEQMELLMRLLHEYTDNMVPEIAGAQVDKIGAAGFGALRFAWAGGTEVGEPHYYRVHGPTVLIEYDNTQNGANHVHSVWRDLTDDFGDDILRLHYDEVDHHRTP